MPRIFAYFNRLPLIIFLLAFCAALAGWLFSGGTDTLLLNCTLWIAGVLPLIFVFIHRKKIRFIGFVGPLAFCFLLIFLEFGLRAGPFNSRLLPLSVGRDFVAHRFLFWVPKNMLPEGWRPVSSEDSASAKSAKDQDLEFRSGPAAIKKAPGVFRIITMGGSNAWGHGIDRYEDTFTALLDRNTKQEFPDRSFEWIAGGVKAFRIFHNLIIYKLLLRDFHPDLIIFYSNVNDGVIMRGPYTYHELFKMRTGVDITQLWITEHEFPKKVNIISRIQDNFRKLRSYNAMVKWIRDMRDEHWNVDGKFDVKKDVNPPSQIEANMRAFVEITRNDGVRLLFADAYQSPDLMTDEASRAIQVQAIMKKVVKNMDVHFLPVNDILHERYEQGQLTLKTDSGHINEFGNDKVAKLLFQKLVDDELLKPAS